MAAASSRASQASAAQSSQILGRSPSSPASAKSLIQLQPTVLRLQDDGEGDEDHAGPATLNHSGRGGYDGDNDDDNDSDDDDGQLPTKIDVGGPSWDDSDDDDDDGGDEGDLRDDAGHLTSRRRKKKQPVDPSYLHSLRPSPSRLRAWFTRLTKSPAAQASLSAPHVSANLFSASLNPAVLLSMPAYFDRTGILIGVIGLIVVATLAGAGGSLWVVLARYVGGSNIEAITAAGCGRNTRWKGNIGRAFSGILLAIYATGTAVIAYFALADLLLQVLFHYSPRGIPLHDRLFVTVIVGGLITAPMVIFPLAKRNLIRLSTFCAVLFYPCIIAILLSYIYGHPQTSSPRAPERHPSLNPLYPPSIWAPFSLLPLLSLSASPLQIIAHNRSLRRRGISGRNVQAFMGAQAAQTFFAVGVAVAFGIGIGTQGMGARLGVEVHPNLFTTLPLSDSLNIARLLFIFILSSHLTLCLVTARSSWSRLLMLFNLNPLRSRSQKRARTVHGDVEGSEHGVAHSDSAPEGSSSGASARVNKPRRRLGRRSRDALAGLLLWALTAFTAYWSGVGGLHHHKGDKTDANDTIVEANFTRAQEVLGLIGAGVGFVLPALVWIIIFHIRRPRAILPPFASDMAKQASAWFLGPQSVLAKRRKAASNGDAEQQPLLDGNDEEEDDVQQEHSSRAFQESLNHTNQGRRPSGSGNSIPYWRNETDDASADEATRILLARKENQMQKRSRGKRLYQDVIVLAGILPLGVSLIVLGALDLRHGGW